MRFSKLALGCALFMGAFVQAHSQTQIRVNVPFDFTVGNHTLPAGQYEVNTVSSTENLTWRINNHQGNSAVMMTNAVSSSKAAHTCSLLFRRSGGEYSLVEFWLDGNEGRDVIRPKIARTVIAQSDLVQIAAER
jgi:hypothetical protein